MFLCVFSHFIIPFTMKYELFFYSTVAKPGTYFVRIYSVMFMFCSVSTVNLFQFLILNFLELFVLYCGRKNFQIICNCVSLFIKEPFVNQNHNFFYMGCLLIVVFVFFMVLPTLQKCLAFLCSLKGSVSAFCKQHLDKIYQNRTWNREANFKKMY